jgi:transcriptional/translational regulatory protein YebC/TACO1
MLAAGLKPDHEEVSMIAGTQVALDAEDAEMMMKLLEVLEELDDVQNVYSNAEISEDILEKLN